MNLLALLVFVRELVEARKYSWNRFQAVWKIFTQNKFLTRLQMSRLIRWCNFSGHYVTFSHNGIIPGQNLRVEEFNNKHFIFRVPKIKFKTLAEIILVMQN